MEVEIGKPLEMLTHKICMDMEDRGMIVYGYKFRPLMGKTNSKIEVISRNGGCFIVTLMKRIDIINKS